MSIKHYIKNRIQDIAKENVKLLIKLAILSCTNQLFGQTTISFTNTTNIGQTTVEFFDKERGRPIITELWYPTTDSIKETDNTFSPLVRELTIRNGKLPVKKYPLIMISHGNGGNRLSLEWLAQHLVQSGYVVAAVDHWGNTHNNKIGIEFVKPWERPLDISFSLTKLLGNKNFKAMINEDKIGALGFSYGGYTVLALAGAVINYDILLEYYNTPKGKKEINSIPEFPNLSVQLNNPALIEMMRCIPNLKDKRFKAFFAISPGTAMGFNKRKQFQEIHSPVYIIGTESDNITPVDSYARKYHKLIVHSEYYEFKGKAGHYIMLAEANDKLKKEDPVLFTDHPSVNRKKVHLKVSELSVSFFNQKLHLNQEITFSK
jgi:predicted dienelactone hydrolase